MFARPDADTGVDWIGETNCGGTVHWQCLDEVIPDNTDFLTSSLISTSNQDIDFIGLTSLTDPTKSDGHVIRAVAREEGLGINAPFLLIELNQGGGAPIATLNITQGTLTTTFTQYEYALTPTEADSITDYTDLEIRMVASCNTGTCNAGGSRDSVSVSWVEFAVLDDPIIPPPTLDTVIVLNSTSLQLDWTEPVDLSNVLSYDIRRFNGTTFNTIGNVLVGNTEFMDIGLIPDTFYTYHIVSKSTSDESVPSNELSQRTTVILFSSSPDSNPSVRWVNGLGNAPCSDLATFECVNETERDDGDFIQSLGLGSSDSDIDIMTMSDMEDPLRADSHFLKYTLRKAGVGTNPVEFTIQLRQGGTEIASFTHSGLTTTYIIFQQELTGVQADSITDYNDLEVTLTASCDGSCSNSPNTREKVNVSFLKFEIEQVSSPQIIKIDTITSSSLRIIWAIDEVDAEIIDIIIQEMNGTDFLNIGNVSTSISTFDHTGLPANKIIKYRLVGMLPSGFAKPSPESTGSTPPSSSSLTGNGTIIEPNANNSFTQGQKEIFAQTTEHYKLNRASLNQIIIDIEVNDLNAYQIINKMIDGSYDSTLEMQNAGSFYANKYLEFQNMNDFFANITSDVILGLDDSSDDGNVPNAGNGDPEP